MDPNHLEKSIFLQAIELTSATEIDEFLNQKCGENRQLRCAVEALLHAHQNEHRLLDKPLLSRESPKFDLVDRFDHGSDIGPYKPLRVIGEGGMGRVYLAEQREPIRRQVALKVIKLGMDTQQFVARFESERQLLALMDHPHIAKVFDAGTTETGRPYFVMELVKGLPINKFCDEQRLDPRERLALFIEVCHAVQHAHQKGIIHRDLKPSNVLVGMYNNTPVPKVIDFGVAKATSEPFTEKTVFTRIGQVVGTLEYMSPEQAQLNQRDIDTRSDIYSLGAILYELLVGTPPFHADTLAEQPLDEALRMIRELDPPTPGQRLRSSQRAAASTAPNRRLDVEKLRRYVRGDLEWIVMKALEKDRSRRYATALDLAEDLQRFIEHRPVEAASASAAYRAKKFIRRNLRQHPMRTGLIAASLLLLVIGISAIYLIQQLSVRAREVRATELLRDGEAYVARIAEARELLSRRQSPWRARALELVEQAAALQLPSRDDVALRSLLATTAVQRDLQPVATIAEGIWCDVLAFDPRGEFLAVGQNKDDTGFSVWIYRVDDFGAEAYDLWIDDAQRTAERKRKNQTKPEDGARAMCFSPDGRQVAVGTRHGRLHVFQWDGQQATHLASYDPDPGSQVDRIYFSRDGQSLWVLSAGNKLRVIRQGLVEPFAPIAENRVYDMAVSPTENAVFVVGTGQDPHIFRYEFDADRPTWKADRVTYGRDYHDVAISTNGLYLALSQDDSSNIDFIETAHGCLRSKTIFENLFATDLDLNPVFGWDNSFVATTSSERFVTLWDVAQGRTLISHLVAQRAGKPCLAASPTQPLLAVAEHLKVTVFRVVGTELLGTFAHANTPIDELSLDSAGNRIATVGSRVLGRYEKFFTYGLWDAARWSPEMTYFQYEFHAGHFVEELSISFSPDEGHLVSVNSRGQAALIPIGPTPADDSAWVSDNQSVWIEPPTVKIENVVDVTPVADPNARNGDAVAIITADNGKVSLGAKLPSVLNNPQDGALHTYVICRLPDAKTPRPVQIKMRCKVDVTHSSRINPDPNGYVAVWAGRYRPANDGSLTLELDFDHAVEQLLFDGILLSRDRLNTAFNRLLPLGPIAVHRGTNSIWSVIDREDIHIVDYDDLQQVNTWTNDSVSHQVGLGTLGPMLAADKWVISGTLGGEVFVFDAESGDLRNAATIADSKVRGLCFLPATTQLVATFNDGSFQILDLPSLERRQTIKHHRLSLESVCYDAQRQWLFAGSEDGTISVWRNQEGRFQHYFTIDLKLGSISRLLYIDQGDRLVALISGETALREIRLDPLCDKLSQLHLLH